MIIVKIHMVTGYWPDHDSLRDAVDGGRMVGIRKYETYENQVVFYIDSAGHEDVCLMLLIDPQIEMDDATSANIIAYDYYEPERRSTKVYTTKCSDETWFPESVNEGTLTTVCKSKVM